MSKLFVSAKRWLKLGVAVVPLQPNSKHIVTGFGGHSKTITTIDAAYFWFAERVCNLAIVPSSGGLVVLDFDDIATYKKWGERWPGMAGTYTEQTKNGFHVVLLGQSRTGNLSGVSKGIEVKGVGAVVASAPSFVSGFEYRAIKPDVPILPVSDGFDLIAKYTPKIAHKAAEIAQEIGPGAVDRVKAAYDVVAIARTVTTLKGRGQHLHGPCPFGGHSSKTAFWVDRQAQKWGCFACGFGGDVINLYATINNLTVSQAIQRMAAAL